MEDSNDLHSEIDLGTTEIEEFVIKEEAVDDSYYSHEEIYHEQQQEMAETDENGYQLQYVDPAEYQQYLNNPEYQQQLADYQAYMYQEYGYVYDASGVPIEAGTEQQAYPVMTQTPNTAVPPPPSDFKIEVMYQSPMMNYDAYYSSTDGQRVPSTSTAYKKGASGDSNKLKRKATCLFANMEDEEILPKEIKKLFLPLNCDLCKIKMNSPISATMHYQSKSHDRKITAWLENWSKTTGQTMPQRKKKPKNVEGPKGENALHCEACDLPLTSVQHANQHYLGKKHRMVVQGKSSPNGSGHYGKDGKWIRTPGAKSDPTGRFGIGSAFLTLKKFDLKNAKLVVSPSLKNNNAAATTQKLSPPPPPPSALMNTISSTRPVSSKPSISRADPRIRPLEMPPPPGTEEIVLDKAAPPVVSSTTKDDPLKNFYQELASQKPTMDELMNTGTYCAVCDVTVTSKIVMETHLAGAKHAKKLKTAISKPPPAVSASGPDSLLTSLKQLPRDKTDFSIYRTPSGQFYCKVCDSTLADENLFGQHMGSKKHKRNTRSVLN